MLTLVLELVQSTWIMLAAVAVRWISLTALTTQESTVTVATQRMLEWDAKVDLRIAVYSYKWSNPYLWKTTGALSKRNSKSTQSDDNHWKGVNHTFIWNCYNLWKNVQLNLPCFTKCKSKCKDKLITSSWWMNMQAEIYCCICNS